MIRTLFIIAGSAFLLCLLSFAGAAALGGADLKRDGWHFTVDEDGSWTWDGDVDASVTTLAEAEGTRSLAWTGGDRLIVDLPGEVVFVEGAEASVEVTGPQSVIDRVRLIDGVLSAEEVVRSERSGALEGGPVSLRSSNRTYWSNEGIRVVVTAPDVSRFELRSSARLEIQDYDQDALDVNISGSGEVQARGRATRLALDISGSGDAEMNDLDVTDAEIDISGSGNARVDATGEVTIDLSGSGDVDLASRPASLSQSITGSGDVDG